MSYVLQSQIDNSLYWNGTILDKRNLNLALFGDINNARIFDEQTEAYQIADIINVPVNVLEV